LSSGTGGGFTVAQSAMMSPACADAAQDAASTPATATMQILRVRFMTSSRV
jgi:hypothetical protein